MEMNASRTLPVTQQQAWEGLNDPGVLKVCIPGCDRFELEQPNVYAAIVALKIGPVSAKFKGKVSLADIQVPDSYSLQFEGSGGAAGFGKGQARVRLEPKGSACELHYEVNAQIGGKIAQIGQRLIDGVAKNLSEKFFQKFEEELVRLHPPAEGAQTETSALATATEKNGNAPPWLWWAGLVGLGIVIAYWVW